MARLSSPSVVLLAVMGGIGPLTPLDTGVPGGAGGQTSSAPIALLVNGSALAVWADNRRVNEHDIFAARIAPTGAVLDPFGIVVAESNSFVALDGPVVEASGSLWLVAYRRAGRIEAVRVDSAGTVLDSVPLLITSSTVGRPAVARHVSGSFTVVWPEATLLNARTVDASGALGAVTPVWSVGEPAREVHAANTATGAIGVSYVLPDAGAVPARLFIVTASGPPSQVAINATASSLSANGDTFSLAWVGANPGFYQDLDTATFSAAGGVKGPFVRAGLVYPSSTTAIAPLNSITDVVAAWVPGGIAATRLFSDAGAGAATLIFPDLTSPELSRNDGPLIGTGVNNGLHYAFFDGGTLRPTRLDRALNFQRQAAGIWDGTKFVVAYEDSRSMSPGLAITEIDATGTRLTPAGLGYSGAFGPYPLFVQDLVSHSGSTRIYFSGYYGALTCSAFDGGPYSADAGGLTFAVTNSIAAGAGRDLVVTGATDVRGRFVDPSCNLQGAEFIISSTGTYGAAGFDGTGFVVAWHRASTLEAARVELDGTVSPAVVVATGVLANPVQLASGSGATLVAWETANGPRWARLGTDAGLLDAVPRALGTGSNSFGPRPVWTGTGWLVAWWVSVVGNVSLFGARISPAGSVLDDGGVPLLDAGTGPPTFKLVGGAGQALLLRQQYDPAPTVRATRTDFVRVDLEPPAQPVVLSPNPSCASNLYTVTVSAEPGSVVARHNLLDGGTATALVSTVGLVNFDLPPDSQSEFSATDDLGNSSPWSPPLVLGALDCLDAGSADAGQLDAGLVDAGSVSDAGVVTPDAGSVTPDAGSVTPDAGFAPPDAGAATPRAVSVACGCTGADGLWGALALLAALRLRSAGASGRRRS